MSDYGITAVGFNRKRLDTIISEMEADLKAVFGVNFNLAPESPDGQMVGIFAKALADLYEIAESSYNSVNVSAATGAALSRLVQLGGVTRKAAAPSRADILVTGTPGAVIPAGSEVKSPDTGAAFTTDDVITLSAGGSGTGTVTAADSGPTAVQAGTIVEVSTPVAGWATVTNPSNGTTGSNEETDAELRTRYIATRGVAGAGTVDAIYAAVSNLSGVTELRVEENRNDSTIIESGLPGHHVRVTVVGGDDDEIAAAIWQNKPAGIGTNGNQFLRLLDSQGNPQGVSFSRPAPVNIHVEILLTGVSDPEGDPKLTGVAALIKTAIVTWAEATIGVGENIIASQLYTPVNEVASGYQVGSLKVKLGSTGALEDVVALASDEIAGFAEANINVLVL